MKYFILCCAVLLALPAPAQVPGFSLGFGIQGDATNVNVGGVVKDIYGLGVGGGIHFDVRSPILSFRVSGDYITLSPDETKYRALAQNYLPPNLAQNLTIEGGRIDVWSANANAKVVLLPIPIVNPYVTGGIGLVRLHVTDATLVVGGQRIPLGQSAASVLQYADQTKTAVNIGAGVDLAFGGLALYGEVKVNWIFTDSQTTVEVPIGTIGITF